ncbi:glycosyltransferase [Terrisporobacter sp.]
MIFITVGTHEQGIDRLLKEIDRLIEEKIIKDKVFAQIGYSVYKPKNFQYEKMIGYDEMEEMVSKSNIVITHGGPGSIFQVIQQNKVPIVFPRNPKYKEHVDNHQILFTKKMEEQGKIIGIYETKDLEKVLASYDTFIKKCKVDVPAHIDFIQQFDTLINEIMM